MLFRSENGGESWRSLCDEAHTPSAANFHGLTVDPEVPGGIPNHRQSHPAGAVGGAIPAMVNTRGLRSGDDTGVLSRIADLYAHPACLRLPAGVQ